MAEPTPFVSDSSLDEIVRRLVAAYRPEKIYLFGSKARGDETPDSDFDVVVIVPDSSPPERRRSRLGYEALRGTGLAVDVLVWTARYFESRRTVTAALPSIVGSEGQLLYAA